MLRLDLNYGLEVTRRTVSPNRPLLKSNGTCRGTLDARRLAVTTDLHEEAVLVAPMLVEVAPFPLLPVLLLKLVLLVDATATFCP